MAAFPVNPRGLANMNRRKFREYNSEEAEAFGKAFVDLFKKNTAKLRDANDTGQWTEVVFDLFAESIGRDDVVLDVHRSKRSDERYEALYHPALREITGAGSLRRSHSRESLVDLSHYRFRSYSDYGSKKRSIRFFSRCGQRFREHR